MSHSARMFCSWPRSRLAFETLFLFSLADNAKKQKKTTKKMAPFDVSSDLAAVMLHEGRKIVETALHANFTTINSLIPSDLVRYIWYSVE